MKSTIGSVVSLLLVGVVFVGCAVGIDAHPLTDAQSAALKTRPAPRSAQSIPELTSLVVRVPIQAPVSRVWDQLAVRYGDVHEWSGPIEHSGLATGNTHGCQGAVRACTLGDNAPIGRGKTFSETIVEWDEERHFFVAGVNDGFYPMRRAVQEFWVEPSADGTTSVVTTQFHFDLSFPMGKGKGLVGKLKPQVVTSLLGLKHLLETGNGTQARDAEFLQAHYPAIYDANGAS